MPTSPPSLELVRQSAPERLRVTVVPTSSPYAAQVREAARGLGVDFVRSGLSEPASLEGQIVVVDLTQVRAAGRLGPRVIAISPRLDLDCYEVISPDQLRARLKRTLKNLVEREELAQRVDAERRSIRTLNEIGFALSAQPTQAGLLDAVLTQARRLMHADAGSIYLVVDGRLRYACSQNDTMSFRVQRAELPIDESSLIGTAAARRELINIPEAAALPDELPWRGALLLDPESGYSTRSVLVAPMLDREGQVIGVLSLTNRKPSPGVPLQSFDLVEPFRSLDEDLAGGVASQAAVALENHRLYRDIHHLFEGFVEAAVTAIEARDPSTGGHSHRVAALSRRLAEAVDAVDHGPLARARFSQQELTELHYAAMLHDFGKVGVREQVLLKGQKLYEWEMLSVENRFHLAALQIMLEERRDTMPVGPGPGGITRARLQSLERDLRLVKRLNKPSIRPSPEEIEELRRISQDWTLPDTGAPLVGPREARRLCIPMGTLDPEERKEIEAHVTHTWNFLRVIPWTRELRQVPHLAYAHHEKLNGTGYPRGLRGEEIPLGARIMTIADIFDALTAGDRPYKPAQSAESALGILRHEAARGHVEGEMVELFAGQCLWEGIVAGS